MCEEMTWALIQQHSQVDSIIGDWFAPIGDGDVRSAYGVIRQGLYFADANWEKHVAIAFSYDVCRKHMRLLWQCWDS